MAGERTHLSSLSGGRDPDDAHGDTVVAEITVKMRRNGCMSTEGSITDEMYAIACLESAIDAVRQFHIRRNKEDGRILVKACDTALVGTEAEKKLLAARDELSNAMADVPSKMVA